jgi:hypothetical protein
MAGERNEQSRQRRAVQLGAGAVVIPGHLADPLWRVLRAHLDRHRRDGGTVRPEIVQLVDTLRAAALDYLTANGHPERTCPDITSSSPEQAFVTTDELAGRLGVSTRQARRIAAHHLVEPVARGLWNAEDVAALEVARRRN